MLNVSLAGGRCCPDPYSEGCGRGFSGLVVTDGMDWQPYTLPQGPFRKRDEPAGWRGAILHR